ncbi:hypothetical protein Tco_0881781 [Tanacetum coccineum]
MKKKDGSFRMCIDHRELNKLTVKNRYPLLRIDDLFDQLRGAYPYLKIDFSQVGLSSYSLMTFWPTQRSKRRTEVHLKLVLASLRKEKLYAKFSKCEFLLEEVHFLGHMINHNIVEPLTSLTERNQKYEWSIEKEEAFQTLKNDLCDTLIKRM